MEYIHLFTHEDMFLFLKITEKLPQDVQKRIWNEVNDIPSCPPPPPNKKKRSEKLENLMAIWKKRKLEF